MTTLAFTITVNHMIIPRDPETGEYITKQPLGTVIEADFRKVRNPAFHRKFMAMVTVAFDYFECGPVEYNGKTVTPQKDFNEFRKWLTVRAGHFYVVGYPDGSVRVRAKSLKFSSMDDDEFSKVYSDVLDVILRDVVDMPKEDYERMVDDVMGFA